MKPSTLIVINVLISLGLILSALNTPAKYWSLSHWLTPQQFGAVSLTDITSTDQLSNFPTVYTNNNTILEDVLNTIIGTTSNSTITTLSGLTSAASLATIGTITTGTWNANAIGVGYGGTGTTSPARYQVILGNGAYGLTIASSTGSSGQLLTSNGSNAYPSWQSASFDTSQNYTLTGNWLWQAAASSTLFAALDKIYIGRTATSTIQANTNASSTLQGYLSVLGSTAATSSFTGNLEVLGGMEIVGKTRHFATTTLAGCVNCLGGYERKTTTFNMDGGSPATGSATLSCSTGKVVLGGGASNVKNVAGARLDSYPDSNSSWTVDIIGSNGENDTITVYAICAYP